MLVASRPARLVRTGGDAGARGLDLGDVDRLLGRLAIDRAVPPVPHLFRGGTSEARRRLGAFVAGPLRVYGDDRAALAAPAVSHLSMYLHFGQISPVEVALAARGARGAGAGAGGAAAFIEQLIVRRELALSFVEHSEDYDRWPALPAWARATLARHARDPRRPRYTRDRLESARTHDPYWNAAMRDMRYTGYLHNRMRMYWGKKILEWSPDPERAHALALALNNRYFIDGRDPSSYANVGWIFGLHDRPWSERPIYGTVRTMTAAGLERKSDMRGYLAAVEARVAEARRAGVRFDRDR
jgi:deoxyribodipyrimidine photo-lyase